MKLSICTKCIYIVLSTFILSSCDYTAAPLPEGFISNYELAIPIADTTFSFKDIADPNELEVVPNNDFIYKKGIIIPYSTEYPFYIAEMSNDDKEVQWIEPKIIINDNFLSKTDIFVSFYIICSNGDFYTLVENKKLAKGETVLLGDKEARVSAALFQSLNGASQLKMRYIIIPKEDVKLSEIVNCSSHIKIGLKVMVRMGFTL